MFLSELPTASENKRLIECVVLRLEQVKLKSKINLDEMHNIGQIIVDIQSAGVEVLINLLIECPTIYSDEVVSTAVLTAILNDMKNQNFSSKIVNSGLRFLALYAKNFPQMLKKVLDEHQVTESFLGLLEMVQDYEIITNGITILTAIYANNEASEEQHEKIWNLLLKHWESKSLRVIWESLNSMFDIYSDEKYDTVLSRLDLIPILENSIEKYYRMLDSEQDNYEDEEIEFFSETLNNLEGFLEYKRSHMN